MKPMIENVMWKRKGYVNMEEAIRILSMRTR